MNDDKAIVVQNLHKTFRLPHEQHNGIKQAILNIFRGRGGVETQHVLDDVSFEIKKGEFFGIVGKNGSGKSTLLKLLAGIYAPDSGLVQVNGSLTPFIELGVGFNPELTGRENIFMNGALLGMSHTEVEAIYDDIVSFAELEKFMDQKLKNYSSGMQVRLAFSIAIRAKSDILLFDEVLAVGDAAFQQKCYEMFGLMKDEGRTIVLVTHDMSAVQRFCERAILIDKGKVTLMGNPSEIADRYLEQNLDVRTKTKNKNSKKDETVNNYAIKQIVLRHENGTDSRVFTTGEPITAEFVVEGEGELQPIRLGFQIFNKDGVYVFGTNSKNAHVAPIEEATARVSVRVEQELGPGTYNINLAVMNKNASKVLRYIPKATSFNIRQDSELQGVVMLKNDWKVE